MQEVRSWCDIEFLNPRKVVIQSGKELPHWQQSQVPCFITFRLADSIPKERMDRWIRERDLWMKAHPPPWKLQDEQAYHQQFTVRFERWLDELHGSCSLRDAAVSDLLLKVLTAFDADRYRHHAWVIMPNHVHLLTTLGPGQLLKQVVRAWKGTSARRILKHLGRTGQGLWQKNYFDRLIRDPDHFRHCARYIRNNPRKSGLKPEGYRLYESPFVQKLLGPGANAGP